MDAIFLIVIASYFVTFLVGYGLTCPGTIAFSTTDKKAVQAERL